MAALDPQTASAGFGSPPSKSGLDQLLKAWGVTFEDSKVLADLDLVARTGQGRAPAVLALNEKAVNKDDIVDRRRRQSVRGLRRSFWRNTGPRLEGDGAPSFIEGF